MATPAEPSAPDAAAADASNDAAAPTVGVGEHNLRDDVAYAAAFAGNLSEYAHTPARLRRVRVTGLKRTREFVVQRELAPARASATFQELVLHLDAAQRRLKRLPAFQNVVVQCDLDPAGDNKSEYDVVVDVRERERWWGLGLGGSWSAKGPYTRITGKLSSALGCAESVEAVVAGTIPKRPDVMQLTVRQPLFEHADNYVELQLRRADDPHVSVSSYGARVSEAVLTLARHHVVEHAVSLIGELRETAPGSAWTTASPSVLSECGPTQKMSVRYVVSTDSRDDALMPTRGRCWRISAEAAGLGGNVRFVKALLAGQLNVPLPIHPLVDGVMLHVAGQAGALVPIGGDLSHIHDRLYLNTLRGFLPHSLGPKAERRAAPPSAHELARGQAAGAAAAPVPAADAADRPPRYDVLGGEVLAAASLRVSVPMRVDLLDGFGVRLRAQAFVNSGLLANREAFTGGGVQGAARGVLDNLRTAVGVGLRVAAFGFGAEVSYTHELPTAAAAGGAAVAAAPASERGDALEYGIVTGDDLK